MSIIKHVTLQEIVAHDFRYDPRIYRGVTRPGREIDHTHLLKLIPILRMSGAIPLLLLYVITAWRVTTLHFA